MMLFSVVEYVGTTETFLFNCNILYLYVLPCIPNQGSHYLFRLKGTGPIKTQGGGHIKLKAYRKMGDSDTPNRNDLEMSLQISEMRVMDFR